MYLSCNVIHSGHTKFTYSCEKISAFVSSLQVHVNMYFIHLRSIPHHSSINILSIEQLPDVIQVLVIYIDVVYINYLMLYLILNA